MNATTKASPFHQAMTRYLTHKRALGCRYRQEEWLLRKIHRYIDQRGGIDLDTGTFERWSSSIRDRHPNTRRKWQEILRTFCLYRLRSEPGCFVPSPDQLVKQRPYITPIILEPEQIARMLNVAATLPESRAWPVRAPAMRLAIVLLYTCGLRLGELLRLTLGDVEDGATVLRVRESKFHRSRLVPLSPSTSRELRGYLKRLSALTVRPNSPLLGNRQGGHVHPYSHSAVQVAINRMFDAARICDAQGRRPRVHDLRHSYAVQSLIRWYREGADVQSSLPKLALFMGHVSIGSTAHYLRWIPALRSLASERFERGFGNLVAGGAQ